jgi:EpsI family protein
MPTRLSFLFLVTAGLLAGTIVVAGLANRRILEPLAVPLERIDSRIDGWQAIGDEKLPAPTLHALDATSYLVRNYAKDNLKISLFIAFYEQQRAGESMHSPKHCLPGAGWEIWRTDSAVIPVNGHEITVNKYSIENGGTRMLMFYWYQTESRIFASEYLGKILLARDTILTGRTAASIVRISLPDVAGASEQGTSFASHLIPAVQRSYGPVELLDMN